MKVIVLSIIALGIGWLTYANSSMASIHTNLGTLLEWSYWQKLEEAAFKLTSFQETIKEINDAISLLSSTYDVYKGLSGKYELIPGKMEMVICLKCIFLEIAEKLSHCYHQSECGGATYCPNPEKRSPGPEKVALSQCCCNPFSKEYYDDLHAKPFAVRFEQLGELLEQKKYKEAEALISVLKPGIAWVKSYLEKNEAKICLTCIEKRSEAVYFALNLLQLSYELLEDDASLIKQQEEKASTPQDLCSKLPSLIYKFWDIDHTLYLEYQRGAERSGERDYLAAINHYKKVISYNEQLVNAAYAILDYIQKYPSLTTFYVRLRKAIYDYKKSPYKEHAEKWIEGLRCLLFHKEDCGKIISYGNKLFEARNKALGELFDAICDIEDFLATKCPNFHRHPWSHRR